MTTPKLEIPFDPNLPREVKYNPENKKKYDMGLMVPMTTQHIGIILEDENGKELERSVVNFNLVVTQVWELENEINLPFLKTIDLYGDTTFNINQFPIVIAELNKLIEFVDDHGLLSDIAETIRFMSKGKQHLYIKFIGD